MNIKVTKAGLILSVLLNLILGSLLFLKSCYDFQSSKSVEKNKKYDLEAIQNKAIAYMHNAICENLYYPNTYDPVKTTVDSVFYGPLTDIECVQAAEELIDLRSQYSSAQNTYNYAIDQIKFHGITDLGTFHWSKDRDEAKSTMKNLQEKIEQRQLIIKNRDFSMDGKFVGWQVVHRYRAADSKGQVSFGNVLYILNPDLTESYFRYSLDNGRNNLESIKEVIETELESNNK